MTISKEKIYEGLQNQLGCKECFYADQKAIQERKQCCTFDGKLNIENQICTNKKSK